MIGHYRQHRVARLNNRQSALANFGKLLYMLRDSSSEWWGLAIAHIEVGLQTEPRRCSGMQYNNCFQTHLKRRHRDGWSTGSPTPSLARDRYQISRLSAVVVKKAFVNLSAGCNNVTVRTREYSPPLCADMGPYPEYYGESEGPRF